MNHSSNKKEVSLTIVFADICQSTKLYEKLGDRKAFDIISKTLNLLQKQAERYEGRFIRTIGDEIMCCFTSAESAGLAACEMHRVVCKESSINRYRVALRVGLHFGPVIDTDDDIHGDAVNVAARAVGLARRDQILTTRETLDNIPNDTYLMTRYIGRITVKGKEQKLDLYEIMWQEDNTMTMADVGFYTRDVEGAARKKLTLEYLNERWYMNDNNSFISVGRSADNDLMVPKHFVSRMHASIEFRNGKFILSDHSTNGLYLQPSNAKSVFVHRDEVTLLGEGIISLGRDPKKEGAQWIKYRVN